MQAEAKLGDVLGAGTPEVMAHEQPVKGWKAIADELGVSESWAQRTGRTRGLPYSQVGAAVFAYPSELHAWLRSFRTGAARPEPTRIDRPLRLAAV